MTVASLLKDRGQTTKIEYIGGWATTGVVVSLAEPAEACRTVELEPPDSLDSARLEDSGGNESFMFSGFASDTKDDADDLVEGTLVRPVRIEGSELADEDAESAALTDSVLGFLIGEAGLVGRTGVEGGALGGAV